MTKLTANELKVLRAADESEYCEYLCDPIWAWSIMDHAGFPNKRSAGGVVSSLSKKGFLIADGTGDDEACITITEAGAAAYVEAVGAENVRKILPDNLIERIKAMNTQATTTDTTVTKKTRAPRKAAEAKPAKAAAKAKEATKKAAKKPAATKAAAKAKEVHGKSTDALREAAQHYQRNTEVKTAGGHPSVTNGDAVAQRLMGLSLDDVYKDAAEVLGETQKSLKEKYAHLNPGMQRMNLGNRMRAVLLAK